MSQRVVHGVENDYLMCSICLGRYTDPRLLPCGHTFCRQCLSDHIQQTVLNQQAGHFSCPIDRGNIPRPGPNIHPREWVNSFPQDAFIVNLLHAVRLYEQGGSSVNPPNPATTRRPQQQQQPATTTTAFRMCIEHPSRPMEFFCLGCNAMVCASCAISNHRTRNCECITYDEAMGRLQPRANALRVRFQNQIFRVEQMVRYGLPGHNSLEQSKANAMQTLNEIESNVDRFTQLCFQNVEDLRQEIQNAGKELPAESRQLADLYDRIQETKLTFDNVINSNSAPDILSWFRRMENQAKEYDRSMAAVTNRSPTQIEISNNPTFEKILRNSLPVASLNINQASRRQLNIQNTFRDPMANITPRDTNQLTSFIPMSSARAPFPVSRPQSLQPQVTPGRTTANNRGRGPQRSKSTINVKNIQEETTTWQLTGIVFVGYSVVVTDLYNNMLRKCSIAGTSDMHLSLVLEGLSGITNLNDPSDVAVTQPEKRRIAIVSTDQELRVKDTIRTNKPYDAICLHHGTNFVVSCFRGSRCIDIIDRVGRIQISMERSRLLRDPRFLTVTSIGHIVVSDREQGHVICMNSEGQVQWTHATPVAPWGVASDGRGKVYVCLDNSDVQSLSEEGTLLQDKFLSVKDGIRVPYAVCARSRQLAITEYGSSLFAPNSPWVHIISV